MKKLSIIILLLTCNYCFATKRTAKKRAIKYSYQEYIGLYGINDTNTAIIDYFFDKRDFCAPGKMSFMPLSIVLTIVIPPIGVGLMTVSIPLLVSGLVTSKRFSLKNLDKALTDYNENKVIPKHIKKNVKLLLEAQQEIRSEEIFAKNLETLQSIRIVTNDNSVIVAK